MPKFLIAVCLALLPSISSAGAISESEFQRCIVAAVTNQETFESLAVDFSRVPSDCGSSIQTYAAAKGHNDVTIALIAVVKKAIDARLVPQLQSPMIVVGELNEASPAANLEDATVLYENDDVQILMVRKR